jgi:general secretion pathway protein D
VKHVAQVSLALAARWLALCLALALPPMTWAQNTPKAASFDFHSVNVSQVVQLIYSQVLVTPYVIDPDVLTDARSVSFRYSSDKGDIRAFLANFLDSLGLAVETKKGVDYIIRRKEADKTEPELDNWVYRPQYRDVNYIARLLAPLFKGGFSINRAICAPEGAKSDKTPPDGSAAALLDQNGDVLIFSGSDKEIAKLKKLLPQVDFALGGGGGAGCGL